MLDLERKMLEISFLAAELTFTIVWFLLRVVVWLRQGRINWKREALAVIIRYVFFPRALADGHVQPLIFDPGAVFPLRVNLVPFALLFDYDNVRDIVWNTVGNMTMMIPTGIVLPIVYKELDSFWKVVGAGALLSLCIEVLQLPFASRASDVDDLILNVLGVAAGYGIYYAVKRLIR